MESQKNEEYLYAMLSDNFNDNIITSDTMSAIVISHKNPHLKVLIFKKNENGEFKPIHRYYLGGKLI